MCLYIVDYSLSIDRVKKEKLIEGFCYSSTVDNVVSRETHIQDYADWFQCGPG